MKLEASISIATNVIDVYHPLALSQCYSHVHISIPELAGNNNTNNVPTASMPPM
jgi:hypothetical protein